MVCPACRAWSDSARRGVACSTCRLALRPAPERRLPAGLLVRPAFVHDGAARRLVHRLKFEGVAAAAEPLADAMVRRLVDPCDVLVPVPRVAARLWRFGIDPAAALCRALSRRTGLPVVHALTAPLWQLPHTAARRHRRSTPRFSGRFEVTGRVVLVDDVLTTGSTMSAALNALGGDVGYAITATVALERTSLHVTRAPPLSESG